MDPNVNENLKAGGSQQPSERWPGGPDEATETENVHLARGRESAKIQPRTVADHVADAHATRYTSDGRTLGK
jgi:hypothetical protein